MMVFVSELILSFNVNTLEIPKSPMTILSSLSKYMLADFISR